MSIFLDPTALYEGRDAGEGSRILAFAKVGPEVVLGARCTVREHAILDGKVTLEDDVTIQSGARLLGRVRLERGVTVGVGSVLGGDSEGGAAEIVVRRFASLGANVTVLPAVEIGRGAVVAPGSVVTQSVPANAIVTGNPATIDAYVEEGLDAGPAISIQELAAGKRTGPEIVTRVPGVTLHPLTNARDLRGALTAAEFAALPFTPQRIFTVYDVPSESIRGAHAHKTCSQLLVCMAGTVSCLVDDGSARTEIVLDSPVAGVHIPPMVWGTQWRYSRDAVLMVFASHPYDPEDYIRDYETFLEERERFDRGE